MSFSDFFKSCVIAGGGAGLMQKTLAALVSVSIQLAVLILLLLAIRAAFKRRISPELRYGLWGVVAVRALVPVSVASRFSIFNLFGAAPEAVPVAEAVYNAPAAALGSGAGNVVPQQAAAAPSAGALHSAASALRPDWMDIALTVWLCGMALMLIYVVLVNARYYIRITRGMQRVDIAAPVPVYSSDIASPCLMLLRGRCAAVLNDAALADPRTTELVMKHELAHRRQGDLIWAAVRNVINIVFWFHPLVWAAAALSRRDCELSADALAMRAMDASEREEYGMALIRMIRRGAKRELVCASTAMTDSKTEMKERIMNISKKTKPLMLIAALALTLALAASVIACTAAKPGQSGAPDEAPPADTGDIPAADTGMPDLSSEPLAEPDESAMFTITLMEDGKAVARKNIYEEDASADAVNKAIFDHMVRSAAWPMDEIGELDTYIEIIQRHEDDTSSFITFVDYDGQPCMASGSMWGYITTTSYNTPAELVGADTLQDDGPLMLTTEEQAISEAVKSALRESVKAGDYETEAHEIIFTERNGDAATFGVLAMYSQWGSRDLLTYPEGVKVSGTGMLPMRITIETSAETGYTIKNVETPRDGSLYIPSVEEMFPEQYLDAALNPSKETEQQLIARQLEQVQQWLADANETATIMTFDYYGPDSSEPDPEAAEMVALARTLVGKPYEVDSNGPDSFGPAGLIRYLMLKQQRTIPAGGCLELSQYDKWGRIENASAVLPGDLLFFTGTDGAVQHAGIYIGDGSFIHASSSNAKVVISRFNVVSDGSAESSYFLDHFSHALRWWS